MWEKTVEGYEVIHSCKDGKQVREMFAEQQDRRTLLTGLRGLRERLAFALNEHVNAWIVDGKTICHQSDRSPLIHDNSAHPQSLALIAEALNFTVRRKALGEFAAALDTLVRTVEER